MTELAIEANEKGEEEHDTIHIIEFADDDFSIKKMSRVNDLSLELKLGEEMKLAIWRSNKDHPGHE